MNKTIFAFILICLFSFDGFSQETNDAASRLERGEDLKVIYRNEASFGAFVHSAGGIGLAVRAGRQVNVDRKRMLEVEIQNYKHPKEVKTVNSYYQSSQGYVYGKVNSILLLRGGVGFQNILFQKSEKKNVEIRYSTFLGGTLAFAKPVYLEIKNSNTLSVPTAQKYDPTIHSQDDIFGKAPFFKGIGGTKVIPAGYAKLALSFEYADRYDAIKAIETGVVADVYPKALEIMAFNKKQNVYVSLYIKMIWGKKWF
jgi:hypothetical protein